MKYDTTLKELFNTLPETFLELLIGKEVKDLELLPVEFPAVSARRADLIMRLVDGKIYHLELQTSDDDKMPWRMLEYFYLIYRQHKQAPIQIVVYIGNRKTNIDHKITLPQLNFSYQRIDIKDINANLLLESKLLSDNMLAILCKVGDIKQTIRLILNKIMLLSKTDRANALTQLLILTGLRGWKVITLQEVKSMPITFEIEENEFLLDIFQQGEQKGLQKGLQEGRQEGRQEGEQKGQAAILQRQLERKFGALPQKTIDRVQSANSEQLEAWSLRIFDFSVLEDILN